MNIIDLEPIAKGALSLAATVVGGINPLAGIIVEWAGTTAFMVIDQQRIEANPTAAAQLAGDRVADLVEAIKLGTT